MRIDEFDYDLPQELIAQHPAEKRDGSRLLVVHRDTGILEHRHFYDVLEYLNPGDCLLMNNSRVIPARLYGVKADTGAQIEFLLIKRIENDCWETMVRPGRRLKPGDRVVFSDGFSAEILEYGAEGTRIVRFDYEGVFMERLEELGKMPLPPYIDREAEAEDRERYQTVYSKEEGSVAAPTAGLHFTKELLAAAEAKGIRTAYVTLHVGIGTFRPVKCENVEEHTMHFEEYSVDQAAADAVNETRAAGGHVVCVGTTSVRTIESAAVFDEASGSYVLRPGSGATGIFIYPGYEFRLTDRLITNFHLPKSTLLMLISALYDREKVLEAYKTAVEERYRFFSYGDACLFL